VKKQEHFIIFQLYGKPGSRENSNSVNVLKKSGVSGDSWQYGDVLAVQLYISHYLGMFRTFTCESAPAPCAKKKAAAEGRTTKKLP